MVLPSILAADFTRLGEQIETVMQAGADGIHVDVMDGHFVPNLTIGPPLVRSLRERFPDLLLDVHLMITNPEQFVEPFVDAGASMITFHIESTLGRKDHHERDVIAQIRRTGVGVGISLNPPAPVGSVEHVVDDVDMVLIMSVHPGFGGQQFIPQTLSKADRLRELAGDRLRIQMDGGVAPDTVDAVRKAGVDVLVAGTAIFAADDIPATIARLRGDGPQ